jgi:RHS repeat-associated protein
LRSVFTRSEGPLGVLPGAITCTPRRSAATRLGFGGQYANDAGVVELRARKYDPTTGQFLTVDPLSELTNDPYGYARDNPLYFEDPRGLFPGEGLVRDVVDLVAVAPYAVYAGSYYAAKGINELGNGSGLRPHCYQGKGMGMASSRGHVWQRPAVAAMILAAGALAALLASSVAFAATSRTPPPEPFLTMVVWPFLAQAPAGLPARREPSTEARVWPHIVGAPQAPNGARWRRAVPSECLRAWA